MLQVGLLGPVVAQADGCDLVLGRPRERALLALLALHARRLVPADLIIDRLWGEDPPPAVRESLQAHVSRLRRSLGPARSALRTEGGGYLLDVEVGAVDAGAFDVEVGLAREAVEAGDTAGAGALLEQALGRWRGPALAGADAPFVASAVVRLEEQRLVAEEERLHVRLALGADPATVAARAAELVAVHHLRERLWAARIVALHRTGAPAAALGAFQDARRAMVEELGVEPSAALRLLERQVLERDPGLDPPATASAVVDATGSGAVAPVAPVHAPPPPVPRVRYATADDGAHIAWQEVGSGPPLLFAPSHLFQLEVAWEHPACAHFLRRLAERHRVLLFDKRGQGLSDRRSTADIDVRSGDIGAVLRAAEVDGPALLVGSSDGATLVGCYAASHPERVRGLVLVSGVLSLGPHRPWALSVEELEAWLADAAARWGSGRSLWSLAPSMAKEPAARAWYGRMERQAMGPGELSFLVQQNARLDWEDRARSIRTPSLVICRDEEVVPVASSKEIADAIPGARLVVLPGEDHLCWFGDADAVVDEIHAFADTLT